MGEFLGLGSLTCSCAHAHVCASVRGRTCGPRWRPGCCSSWLTPAPSPDTHPWPTGVAPHPAPPPPQAQEVISRWRPSAIVSRWPSDVPDGGEPWALPRGVRQVSDFGRDGTVAVVSPFLFSQGFFQGEPPFFPCSEPISGSASGRHQRAQNPSQALLLGGTSVSLPLSLPCLCVSCGCADDVGFSHR